MATNNATVWWSVPGDLEDLSGVGAGVLTLYYGRGGITGLKALGNLFFIFQEKSYNVYQYLTGDSPLQYVMTVDVGCNFDRTIVEIGGFLYYLSDTGDIRRTNGSTDEIISSRIKPITNKIIDDKSIADYYGSYPNIIPHAIWDSYNNAYRLFYAGTSSYCDKCITYFVDRDIFVTSSGTNYLTSINSLGYDGYPVTLGNSAGTGVTSVLYPNYSATNKTGTLDLGWISSGDPKNQIKLHNIELWLHAQAGVTAGTNCNATLTVSVYTDPTTNAVTDTATETLAYNSAADNLQKKRIQLNATGEYIRLVITDSGVSNYSINRIIVDYDTLESVR